jgi:hypothetical protein
MPTSSRRRSSTLFTVFRATLKYFWVSMYNTLFILTFLFLQASNELYLWEVPTVFLLYNTCCVRIAAVAILKPAISSIFFQQRNDVTRLQYRSVLSVSLNEQWSHNSPSIHCAPQANIQRLLYRSVVIYENEHMQLQLLRKWCEQRPSNNNDLYSVPRGRLGQSIIRGLTRFWFHFVPPYVTAGLLSK